MITFGEFEILLFDCFSEWSNTCGRQISQSDRQALCEFINQEYELEDNKHRIYPKRLDLLASIHFNIEEGYGLEDIKSFLEFLETQLGVG